MLSLPMLVPVPGFRTSALMWRDVVGMLFFLSQTTFRPVVHSAARSALDSKRWTTFTRFEWVLLTTVATFGG